MEHYTLQEEEVVICKGTAKTTEKPFSQVEVLLTNWVFVFITKTKKLFGKEQVSVETYPIESVKQFKEQYQIKQTDCVVDCYFLDCVKSVEFNSKKEAHKFVAKAIEFLTGKHAFFRGIDKTKKFVGELEETLGVDAAEVASFVASKGTNAIVQKVLGKKKTVKTKETLQLPTGIVKRKETKELSPLSPEQQIQAVKQLNELLTSGIITQEDFEKKKKEILGV